MMKHLSVLFPSKEDRFYFQVHSSSNFVKVINNRDYNTFDFKYTNYDLIIQQHSLEYFTEKYKLSFQSVFVPPLVVL